MVSTSRFCICPGYIASKKAEDVHDYITASQLVELYNVPKNSYHVWSPEHCLYNSCKGIELHPRYEGNYFDVSWMAEPKLSTENESDVQ